MWFLIALAVWLAVGFGSTALLIYSELRKGENLTLGEAAMGFGVSLLGPVAFAIVLSELFSEHKNIVLIHGKKKE
jgi:hypothetical protein